MGRVLRLRNLTLVSLVALAALLLVLGRGSDPATATVFTPSGLALVAGGTSDPAGAASSVTQGQALVEEVPSSLATFTPCASWPDTATDCWSVTPGTTVPTGTPVPTGSIPIGDRTGTVAATIALGLANGDCDRSAPTVLTGLPVINASVDISAGNVIVALPNYVNYFEDDGDWDNDGTVDHDPGVDLDGAAFGKQNGIPDGADGYPDVLLKRIPAPPLQRSYIQLAGFIGTSTNIVADIPTYTPGILGPAALGYGTVVVIENFNPEEIPVPTSITDTCGFIVSLTTPATTGAGPRLPDASPHTGFDAAYPIITAGGTAMRSNPVTPGTKPFFSVLISNRDAEGDGIDNGDDTCPYTANVGSPYVSGAGDGDGAEGAFSDGIDAACDNSSVFTPPFPAIPWGKDSGCRIIPGDNGDAIDCDKDGFSNRDDDCPQHPNPIQGPETETLQPTMIDEGPQDDLIGSVCDVNPTVSDGHFHQSLTLSPICITVPAGPGLEFGDPFAPPPFDAAPFTSFPFATLPLFGDFDGDGWCNVEELALGSGMFDGAFGAGVDVPGTPENIAVPTTCSDGADNDGDTDTDLGILFGTTDLGCLETQHDIEATIDDAASVIFDPGNSCMSTNETNARGNALYKIKIEEDIGPDPAATAKPILIGFLIDVVPGSGGSVALTSTTGALATTVTAAVTAAFLDNSPSDDTIVRSTGSWISDGFAAAQSVRVSGTASNDGTVLIASVSDLVLTLDFGEALTAEAAVSSTFRVGAGSRVIDVQGADVIADGPMNIDGDTDVERLTLMERTGEKTVEVIVNYDDLGTCVDGGTPAASDAGDYTVIVDVCLQGDPAPLGLSMLPTAGPGIPSNCGSPSADGDQDANLLNDLAASITVDSLSD